MKYNSQGFSMIEIMIGIFIFSLGMISIYAILTSTVNINTYNKNYIIASNIAREQLEQVRNIRDSNYAVIKKYNQIDPSGTDYNELIEVNKYYKIENDYSDTASFPVSLEEIIAADFGEGESELINKMKNYKLCLDSENRYTYDCSTTSGNKETKFYKYIYIKEVEDVNGVIPNTFQVKSKVIWNIKGYHEFEVDSIIADWKRL